MHDLSDFYSYISTPPIPVFVNVFVSYFTRVMLVYAVCVGSHKWKDFIFLQGIEVF